jgi:hypothetical protein
MEQTGHLLHYFFGAACCFSLFSCVMAPLPANQSDHKKLIDGTYESMYSIWLNKAKVIMNAAQKALEKSYGDDY